MNGYKVVVVIAIYSMIGGGFVNCLRGKKGQSYAKTKAKMTIKEGSLVVRDELSEADTEATALPYIALPPNNVLPDDEKKMVSTSNFGNKNTVTKQHIPVTAVPLVFTSTQPSTTQIPFPKPSIHTPTTHPPTTPPTPQPVNINLVLPTMPPIVQKPSSPSTHPKDGEDSNVTKIDLSLNIGEEYQKEKPVVIQLPPTPPPSGVSEVVSQLQKAQELNSQLALLTNPQLQRAFQVPPFLNTPPAVASMLGMRNPYDPLRNPYDQLRNPYDPLRNPLSMEEMVSQNTRYPPGNLPQNILPFQQVPELLSTLQQGLTKPNNPLMGPLNANQLAPVSSLSSLLSNAIKSSLTQSQPDLITSALTQAASQVQSQNQSPQLLTSALTQAIAKIVSQNNEPSEEQKLTEVLGAALNLAKTQESQKRFLPFPTPSSLKVEIVNPTTSSLIPINQILKQAKFTGPGEQQIISLNVSPFSPQQMPGNIPPVLPQQNPGYAPPVLPQPNPANAPPVVRQPNPANAQPALPQPDIADSPPLLPQLKPVNAPALPQPQVLPPQNAPAYAPPMPSNTANAASISPQMPNQQPSYTSPILDQMTANALGKAMAKALVHTAKKIVYNKPATQRDKIISSINMVHFPRSLENFIRTTFFHSNITPYPYLRTFLPIDHGLKAFRPPFGPFKMKYLRHRCCCCC